MVNRKSAFFPPLFPGFQRGMERTTLKASAFKTESAPLNISGFVTLPSFSTTMRTTTLYGFRPFIPSDSTKREVISCNHPGKSPGNSGISSTIIEIASSETVSQANTVAGKEFTKNPGLHRTMLGDGLACICAGFIGGPPVTTYSEVTGAVSLTKITDPAVIRISAVVAILFALLGKVCALLICIPSAVLGGIMLLLFGTIASLGINNMVTHKTDLSDSRNLIIASLILTVGIGGAVLQWGSFSMAGIGLAALLGLLLNIILPKEQSRTKSKEEKA